MWGECVQVTALDSSGGYTGSLETSATATSAKRLTVAEVRPTEADTPPIPAGTSAPRPPPPFIAWSSEPAIRVIVPSAVIRRALYVVIIQHLILIIKASNAFLTYI